MAKVILGMTMSMDGYVNDREGDSDALSDLTSMRKSKMLEQAIEDTGAVVMGRNTFAMSDDPNWYAGNYEFQVPIFVLTKKAPESKPKESGKLTITFVTDGIESAIAQAKAAAGEKSVMVVGGPDLGRQLLEAGLVDELDIGIQPILLGGGLRFFELLRKEIRLEKVQATEEIPGRTDLLFRVVN